MLNSNWWKHLANRTVILVLLKFGILLLLVIGDSLFVSTFAICLHLRVLEILHAFVLLECIMRRNCSHYCSLLGCRSCGHILKLVRPERHVEWMHISTAHDMTSICQTTLRNLVSSLEAMTCHVMIEMDHIVVILVQH